MKIIILTVLAVFLFALLSPFIALADDEQAKIDRVLSVIHDSGTLQQMQSDLSDPANTQTWFAHDPFVFLFDDAYKLYYFKTDITLVKHYAVAGNIGGDISDEYVWWVPTQDGMLCRVAKDDGGPWSVRGVIDWSEHIPEVAPPIFDIRAIAKYIANNIDITALQEIKFVDDTAYMNETFIYVKCGEQEYVIPRACRIDWGGPMDNVIYTAQQIVYYLNAIYDFNDNGFVLKSVEIYWARYYRQYQYNTIVGIAMTSLLCVTGVSAAWAAYKKRKEISYIK